MNNAERIRQLKKDSMMGGEDLRALLTSLTPDEEQLLYDAACEVRRSVYGTDVYLRGLIEFSSYCRNNCLYCGLRRGNEKCQRYRLSREEILECADKGYELGFRTIVLQSGEDPWYTDAWICSVVSQIKERHPDTAVTLSIGEKGRESYQAYYDAGADRYLLRHETINAEHYKLLHPEEMSRENRIRCLYDLKEIGYQVGCGIMVGSPYQTVQHIVQDLLFMKEFRPQMIGIGPFIPHKDTPFGNRNRGTLQDTLHLLAITRLLLPDVLLPATTALGTIDPGGREKGILAGANVVMPNLSPAAVREKYMLYDGKICTGDEAAECRRCLERRISSIGFQVVVSRGDWAGKKTI